MTPDKMKKCAHPPCTCRSSDKYCSAQCQAMEKTPDVSCSCNHSDCGGRAR